MDQLKAALIRGLILALLTAGSTFFTALGTTDDTRKAWIAAGGAFFATLATRVGEGGYDAYRDANGISRPGDVSGNSGGG